MEYIENKTFDEIAIGDQASLDRRLTMDDIKLFAYVSGDVNPTSLDEEFAKQDMFHQVIANGMWGGSLISSVLGTQLPGPGTIYLGQTLTFLKPVKLGEVLTIKVTVKEKLESGSRVVLTCEGTTLDGGLVIEGEATVIAPTEKVRRQRAELPEVRLRDQRGQINRIMAMAEAPEPIPTAVVHPVNESSLVGAVEAAHENLIIPILVGPKAKIQKAADDAGVDISQYELIDTEHSHEAAEKAVELARTLKVGAIMKGNLHTDELMRACLHKTEGIRTDRRVSHTFVMDVPTYPRLLLITDAAINIAPNLMQKADIMQNAIDLAHSLNVPNPKVAVLSAVETVTPQMQSTLDAAALCKMADRGQITGGVVDGPLAFDNAVSIEAARTKGIVSDVAGHADIMLVPDIEAGNMLAKQLGHLGDAVSAGIVTGLRVPIILTSRSDGPVERKASCALALLASRGVKDD